MRSLSAQPGLDVRAWFSSLLITAVACSAGQRPTAVPSVVTQPPPKPRVVWSRFAEVRSWPIVTEPFANTGHVGAGPRATVRVSPEARSIYEHLVRDSELPDGALVALFHELSPGHAGPVYVMEKSGGRWRFMTCQPDGTDLEPAELDPDSSRGCERCHSEGVADSLFGVPRRADAGLR